MPEHANAVKTRRALEAMNQRDFETFSDLFSDDIVAHMPNPSEQGAQVHFEARQSSST